MYQQSMLMCSVCLTCVVAVVAGFLLCLSPSYLRHRDLSRCATGRWDDGARPTCLTNGAAPFQWHCILRDTCRLDPKYRCDRSPPPSPAVALSVIHFKERDNKRKDEYADLIMTCK